MKRNLASSVIAALALGASALAAEDFAFVYRGRITSESGNTAIPSEIQVKYALYKGEYDRTPVWTQTKTEKPSADGAFQSILSGNNLQAAFLDNGAHYLGVTLGDAPEQTPRQEVLSSPLAKYAERVSVAPHSASFVEANVRELVANTVNVDSLNITNSLDFCGTGDFAISKLQMGSLRSHVKILKPENGHVEVFGQSSVGPINHTKGQQHKGELPMGFVTLVATKDPSNNQDAKWDNSNIKIPMIITVPMNKNYLDLPECADADGTIYCTPYSGN